ncbi:MULTISPECIES: winged helix-turn-helix transcriptional regulator [Variovorax]|jgi:DNA-binding HxlR family transcriptional regulator|uniref:winged helix-turn-helix transcriptional regulator n=1 Tax=Variovorax TaxID=34072 RepID=UPI00036E4D39|nr:MULTISPECIES: helix-turn-helix domain-containing protein [Variovorax]MBB3638355.1 DNA-binding HxlR family transcriptional regulator [Variovorax sp. BK613]MDR6519796.1 DNA-binding HxlR family transcriptional regulator [Variovorax paradoxus]
MAQRKSLKADACPMARALDIVGDQWSLLVIRDAFDGMKRFGEFQQSLGVAKNILSDRLKNLVQEGVLELVPASDGSAYQEYVLTAKGKGLFPVVVGLRHWGEAHLYAKGEPHSVLVERDSGKPVPKIELRARDGKPLDPDATFVKKLPATARVAR